MNVNVRGVDEHLWRELRAAAVRRNTPLGALLNDIVRQWLALDSIDVEIDKTQTDAELLSQALRSAAYREADLRQLEADNERLQAEFVLCNEAGKRLSTENERLKEMLEAEDLAGFYQENSRLRAEIERLRAALEEIHAGGQVSMRAWQLALIAAKALSSITPVTTPVLGVTDEKTDDPSVAL